MAQEPFLLDRGYEGTLDSDAFRERCFNLSVQRLIPGWLVPVATLFGMSPSLIFLIVGLVRHDPTEYALSGGMSFIGVMAFGGTFFAYWQDRKVRVFNRRFARECRPMMGQIVTCLRKTYGKDGYQGFVEVTYMLRTPSGTELRGVKALQRDDLLNATLPQAGHPVVVLVLDDRWHLML
jgi:hypothetical protein